MKAQVKPLFVALVMLILMGGLWHPRTVSANEENQLAVVRGKVVDGEGKVITGLSAQVSIFGYSYANTPDWAEVERSVEILDGQFETEIPPGVYTFAIRRSIDEEPYFFTYVSHLEIEASSQVDLVFDQVDADSILNIELIDLQSGEVIEEYGAELFVRSTEISGVLNRIELNQPGVENRFTLPPGKLEFGISIFYSRFDYEIIDHRFEVDLIAGETTDVKLFFARNDSRFEGKVVDSEGNPLSVGMHLYGQGEIEGMRLHKFSEDDGSFDINLPAGTYLVEVDKYNMPDEFGVPDPLLITVAPNAPLPLQTIRLDKLTSGLSGTITVKGLTHDDKIYMYEGLNGIGDPITLISDGKDAVGRFDVPLANGAYLIGFGREGLSLEFRGGIIDVNGKTEFNVVTQRRDGPHDEIFLSYVEVGMSSRFPLSLELENGAKASMRANTVPHSYFREVALVGWHNSPLNRGLAPHGFTYTLSDSFLAIWDFRTPYLDIFQHPVQVTLPYDPALLKTGDPAELRVYKSYLNRFVAPDFVDTENQTVSFTVDRFSSFGLMMQGDESNLPKVISYQTFLPAIR